MRVLSLIKRWRTTIKWPLTAMHASDLACLTPTVYFLIITSSYWGQTPALDAMYYYRQAIELFTHGLTYVITINSAIHPPLFLYSNSIFFRILGASPYAYSALGLTLLFSTSLFLYFFLKSLFERTSALMITVLLFINPYIVSNFLYPNPETMLLSFIIMALYAYMFEKSLLLGLINACLFLTKETGLVFAFCFTGLHIYRIFSKKELQTSRKYKLSSLAKAILPLTLAFLLWSFFTTGFSDTWKSSYLFEETHESSYAIFAIKRIINIQFINQYLIQNIFNIFALNFQWIYSTSLLMLWLLSIKHPSMLNEKQRNISYTILLTSSVYMFAVLSFPTWTIPRYGLVLLFPLFFFLTMLIQKIQIKGVKRILFTFFIGISVVANTSSIDPLSRLLGTTVIAEERLYNSGTNTNGDDALTYNLQYMKPVSRQNHLIYEATRNSADVLVTNCNEFKLWERIYSLNQYPFAYPQFPHTKPLDCLSPEEFSDKVIQGDMAEKAVYIQTETGEWSTVIY